MMWGWFPPPPVPRTPPGPYEIVWLCGGCSKKRKATKKPHRAEDTLLPAEVKYCRDCRECHSCAAFRDYGKD